jgi:hypothetical protein
MYSSLIQALSKRVSGNIILKWILETVLGLAGSDAGQMECCLELGKELSGSVNGADFFFLILASQQIDPIDDTSGFFSRGTRFDSQR